MIALRDVLTQSERDGVALGHFNVANLVMLKAVLTAASEMHVPVLPKENESSWELANLPFCSRVCAKNLIWRHFSTPTIHIQSRKRWKRRKLASMRW
jgi:fructose/tagatose bisphosphate aldolase